MTIAEYGLYSPNLICVCIDKAQKGDYAGNIWHQYSDDPVQYTNTIDLINKMEKLYDEWDFPQKSTGNRSFSTKKEPRERKYGRKAGLEMSAERMNDKKGDKGTFIIRVKYRQNSTWQGEAVWLEKNEKQYFRSALELLKLIDGALDTEDEAEPESEK